MFSILIVIIYLSFISLGLPDSLLGSSWPAMYPQLNVPVSYAGIISMTIALCTVFSSLMSDRVTRRFGTGKVTAVCYNGARADGVDARENAEKSEKHSKQCLTPRIIRVTAS